ncbi:MAG TPA: NADH-quinone oxidoreductase subunit N [Candidatus Limnocylindrales bacterium]|nr:NADH-quinone oxidoreductase subunit N [Candidatus Limnocylindrales bacterium]
MTASDAALLAPFIAAILLAAAILVVDFIAPGRKTPALFVTFAGLALVAVITVLTGQSAAAEPTGRLEAFGGAYVVDALTTFLDILFIAIVALTVAFAPDYFEQRGLPVAEFAAVLVFAMSGAMLLAGSADLLILFLGLELMVLPGYMLAGYHKSDGYSTEGAIKYFLLGSFSSAIFLFGLAFVWGITGTTNIADVAGYLGQVATGTVPLTPGLGMGLAFLMTGVAFKIAAVPFHYWTPDAYQGSPTPITGYLSVGPKVGAFALIIRLFGDALGPLANEWNAVVMVLAALTMTLGNLVALTQDNVKRMLAYSSIAHTGYMLVGFAAYGAGEVLGLEGLLFYAAAYAFMNLGAFAVIAAVQKRLGLTSNLSTFAGLIRREPGLALMMTLFLLSLTGIPPTAGFFGKFYVILAAVNAGPVNGWLYVLAVITMLNAAIAAFYYLRVVVYMWMREPDTEQPVLRHGRLVWAGLTVATILTVALGLFPGVLLAIVETAAAAVTAVGV